MEEGNVTKIINYLEINGVFYVTDLLISNYGLFLIPFEDFKEKFDTIKDKLGSDCQDSLDNDYSLILNIYKD